MYERGARTGLIARVNAISIYYSIVLYLRGKLACSIDHVQAIFLEAQKFMREEHILAFELSSKVQAISHNYVPS